MDVHVPDSVTRGLRRRQVDVLTSQEDDTRTLNDEDLLNRASVLDRLLFTQDADLLRIAQERQELGVPFSGVAFSSQFGVSIGQLVDDLALLAKCCDSDELANRVTYLPLR